MYSIIEAKEKNGTNLRVTLNTGALGQIQQKNASQIAIIIIQSTNLSENDSWNEIEDYFQLELDKIDN